MQDSAPAKPREAPEKKKATPADAGKKDAEKLLAEALAVAKQDGKKVFLHFGAPWCGWCKKLEAWLATDEVARILGPEFVDLKIDIDDMISGKEVQARFRKGRRDGIPWFAFLDGDGKVLVDSDGPKGNVGYPATPEEIDHFIAMLEKTTQKLAALDLAAIRKSLEAAERPATRALPLRRPGTASRPSGGGR
jgi:thiol-disulfide isomerase/thioredoxin